MHAPRKHSNKQNSYRLSRRSTKAASRTNPRLRCQPGGAALTSRDSPCRVSFQLSCTKVGKKHSTRMKLRIGHCVGGNYHNCQSPVTNGSKMTLLAIVNKRTNSRWLRRLLRRCSAFKKLQCRWAYIGFSWTTSSMIRNSIEHISLISHINL